MVKYWLHEKKLLDVSKSYLAMFNTKIVQDDEAKWKPILTAHVVYLALAMFDNEQADMLHKLDTMEAKKLDKVPVFQQLVKTFIRKELSKWPLQGQADLQSHAAFQETPHEGGKERWDILRKRVMQ